MVQKFRGTEIITSQNILKKTKKKGSDLKTFPKPCMHSQTNQRMQKAAHEFDLPFL
jgi:hypothetical protein